MLKENEKIIFSIKSGFSLNGLKDYSLDDKCLQFTNLGNIYISKVDCLERECSDYIMYDYSAHGISLNSEIDSESINIVSEYLPFNIYKNGIEKSIDLSIIIVLDFEEFSVIDNQIEKMIFDFKQGDTLMILDGRYTYPGRFTGEEDSIIFTAEGREYRFRFKDVEYFSEEYNRIKLEGYFYIDENLNIIRKVSFVGNLSEYKLPLGFELLVESNNKIGFLPFDDKMVICEITGRMGADIYNRKEMFLIKHNNMFIFYDRSSKKEILCRNIEHYSTYNTGGNEFIVYDGVNVYKMAINSKNVQRIGWNKIDAITDKYIGYTEKGNPFFIMLSNESINICNSRENCVLEIEKARISDIKVNEENSIENGDFVNTEIKYGDKKLRVNLKRTLIVDMTENVFSDYQISLFENAGIDEVYENWVKTVSDMVVYNIFGEVYQLCSDFLKPFDFNSDVVECIKFVNEYYYKIEKQKKKIDNITVQLPGILEKNEINYFRGMGIDGEFSELEKIRNVMLEVRKSVNSDFNEVIGKFNVINHVIMPAEHIDDFADRLSIHDMYHIEYFTESGYECLVHFLQDLLPFYVEKVIVTVFETYIKLYDNYKKIDEMELKYELMNRIKSAHVFKQFTIESNSSVLRKDVVDDLYSLVKFSSMRVDSEFYYTGGYN